MYFGLALAFFGYRLFKFLLPIVGFLFGFGLGAQSIAILLNQSFLATVIGWVTGFFIGLLFAFLAYWIFIFAVAVVSAAFGYLLGYVLMVGVFNTTAFWGWLIGLLLAFGLAFAVVYLKIYKYAIVIFTAFLGASLSLTGLLLPFNVFKLTDFVSGAPLRSLLSRTDSWLLILTWLAVVVLGIIVQLRTKTETAVMVETRQAPEAPLTATAPVVAAPAVAAVAAVAAVPEPAPAPVVEEVMAEATADEGLPVAAMVAETAGEEGVEPVAEMPAEAEAETLDTRVAVSIDDLSEDQLNYLNQEVRYVEGIGPAYGAKFNENGVMTVLDLLSAGATRKGRADLAASTGLSAALILRWVNHADLIRVKGIGSQYADLLEEAGVDTVVELAHRNAENLHNKLSEVNAVKSLVRQLPSLSTVQDWVELAKTLPRVVSY
jgi:predicted flap endonuclease-1-like 5' DNA nuclease